MAHEMYIPFAELYSLTLGLEKQVFWPSQGHEYWARICISEVLTTHHLLLQKMQLWEMGL